jgi:hypothetical protein
MYLNCDLEMFYHSCSTSTMCEISSTVQDSEIVYIVNTRSTHYEESWIMIDIVIIRYNNVGNETKTFQKDRCQHSVIQTDYG